METEGNKKKSYNLFLGKEGNLEIRKKSTLIRRLSEKNMGYEPYNVIVTDDGRLCVIDIEQDEIWCSQD